MRYLIDLFGIVLMGDGLAKLLSPRSHNRFYQFSGAPDWYNQFLQGLADHPGRNAVLAILLIATGGLISSRMERLT